MPDIVTKDAVDTKLRSALSTAAGWSAAGAVTGATPIYNPPPEDGIRFGFDQASGRVSATIEAVGRALLGDLLWSKNYPQARLTPPNMLGALHFGDLVDQVTPWLNFLVSRATLTTVARALSLPHPEHVGEAQAVLPWVNVGAAHSFVLTLADMVAQSLVPIDFVDIVNDENALINAGTVGDIRDILLNGAVGSAISATW